jgi:hypothetical protein
MDKVQKHNSFNTLNFCLEKKTPKKSSVHLVKVPRNWQPSKLILQAVAQGS